MKIEMGESLFNSWLRHVKECQIVQNSWKISPSWKLQHETDLFSLMQAADQLFSAKYNYSIFKKNSSLSQILRQGECDVIGISLQNGLSHIYAVDVAFHESGLQYGNRPETVMKVVAKIIRTAMCLWGYMGCKEGEIIFASPKITPAVLKDILPCVEDINNIFTDNGFRFKASIVANSDFHHFILRPILEMSGNVADTSELFMRSYQLYHMFTNNK